MKYTLTVPSLKMSYIGENSGDIIAQTEAFARQELAHNDASHDYEHVDRVRNLALRIASEERVPLEASEPGSLDQEMVQVCALLHDVDDHKYKKPGDDESKAETFLNEIVRLKHDNLRRNPI
eukprot:gb/GECG01006205.1/.p1 GENE.gb/GECG01006205.1/~~gb/GECG01006205.1/.p1  ORF type:complete len:122 (+),score=15.90 gb/GECG01006205.1/:1-366(+)